MSERSRYALQRIFILASHREDGFMPATLVINRLHNLPCFSERSFKAPGHGCVRKRRPATSRAVISLAPKVSASRLADSAVHLSAFLVIPCHKYDRNARRPRPGTGPRGARSDWMYSVGRQPWFRQYHSDPRFVKLLESLSLPRQS